MAGDPYLGIARLVAGLVGGGFDYAAVMEMTWSQWEYFSRATRIAEIEQMEMLLTVEHNVYAKEPERIGLRLRAEKAGLLRAPTAKRRRVEPAGGIRLQDIERALGPIETVRLTPEEMEKRLGPRQHPQG